jgi:PAS domain S-box-containing protein
MVMLRGETNLGKKAKKTKAPEINISSQQNYLLEELLGFRLTVGEIETPGFKHSKVKEELYKSDERSKRIFDLYPEAVVLLDRNGRVLNINKKLYNWLHCTAHDIIGKDFLELEYLSGKSKSTLRRIFLQHILGENIPLYKINFISNKGEERLGEVMTAPIRDKNNKIIQYLLIITDVTKGKGI